MSPDQRDTIPAPVAGIDPDVIDAVADDLADIIAAIEGDVRDHHDQRRLVVAVAATKPIAKG
jgi:hypothetical protein